MSLGVRPAGNRREREVEGREMGHGVGAWIGLRGAGDPVGRSATEAPRGNGPGLRLQLSRFNRSWSKGRLVGALGCGVLLLCSACGTPSSASGSSASPGQVTLTLYSAQHEQTTDEMVAAFTKETGIQVRVENDDEDVLTAQIEQEGGRSPADVFYTENSNWLAQLDARGMLSRVDSSTLAQVPGPDSASDGDWVGVSERVSALIYNTSKLSLDQLPGSIMQLAQPQWRGKIEIAPGETDFWPVVVSVYKAYGQSATLAWLKGLKANAGANDDVPDNETITSDVTAGNSTLGLINTYYYYRLLAESPQDAGRSKLAYLSDGDPGYVAGISAAGVLKSSRHQVQAQELLAFMTSTAGQSVLAQGDSFEYPIHPGVAANPEVPPLADLHPNAFSPGDLGTGEIAQELLQEAGLI